MDMNSMTSGDILTFMLFVVGVTVSVWALLVACALVFPLRAQYAQHYYETAPWRTFFVGLPLGGFGNFLAIALLNAKPPVIKIAGWLVLSLIYAVSIVGATGLVRLAASRIAGMENQPTGFGALARGAGLLVLAAMVPFLGWFAITPIISLIACGAGIQALAFRPVRTPQPVSVEYPFEAVQ